MYGKLYAIKSGKIVPIFGHTLLSGAQFVKAVDRLNVDCLVCVDITNVKTHNQVFVCYSNFGDCRAKAYAEKIEQQIDGAILDCKNIFLTIATSHPVVYITGATNHSPDKIFDAIVASASSV